VAFSGELATQDATRLTALSVPALVSAGIAAIEAAGSFHELKDIRDKAEALRVYQRSIGAAQDAVNAAAEIRVRAERRMGEELAKAELATGGGPVRSDIGKAPVGQDDSSRPTPATSSKPKLSDIGISRDQSSRYQHLADIPEDTFEAAIEAHKNLDEPVSAASVARVADALGELPEEAREELVARGEAEILEAAKRIRSAKSEERRGERIAKLAEISRGNAELETAERYPIVLADPPWRYDYAETTNREIENHYPTMDFDELKALPVGNVVTDDAVLYLWATSPKLSESMQILDAWGFTYRTCMVWVKDKIGMGYWARQQHELVLIATRGSMPPPSPSDRPPSVFRGDRTEHSAKPPVLHEMIERAFPELPKLEMFSRSPRGGWDAWGNQSSEAA
jgi:N6-adenosine-specific RNA methylase IME4